MNKFLISASAAAIMLAASSSQAAPVYNWTGFYVGVQGGYAWGEDTTTEFVDATGLPTGFSQDFDLDGFTGGAHAGYNFPVSNFILGLEGDILPGFVTNSVFISSFKAKELC